MEQQPPNQGHRLLLQLGKMSIFFPIERRCSSSLSLNCRPVCLFLSPLSPCWVFPSCKFLKSWRSYLFCESQNSDALSVWIWSDDQMKADWFHWRFQRLWGVYWILRQGETASSQIGNHRHQQSAAAESFAREKSDFESWTTGNQDCEAARSNRPLQNKQPGLLDECCNTLLLLNILLNYNRSNLAF